MNAYTIHVNGRAYAGIDYDSDEPAARRWQYERLLAYLIGALP